MPNIRRNSRAYEILSGRAGGVLKVVREYILYLNRGEPMSKIKKRRHYSGDEKATILRRHLVDKVASSDFCDQYRLSPAMFYR